jgi:phosphate:Na+ symporter
VTLLAGDHAAYNIAERGSPLTRGVDPAALVTPIAAEEAVRRRVARSLGTMCGSIGEALTATNHGILSVPGKMLMQ